MVYGASVENKDMINTNVKGVDYQKLISENIRLRGYYDGYEPVPLIARHVAKLLEEVIEFSDYIFFNEIADNGPIQRLGISMSRVAANAREAFDNGDWSGASLLLTRSQEIQKELADCLVVIMSMAQVISDNFGEMYCKLRWTRAMLILRGV